MASRSGRRVSVISFVIMCKPQPSKYPALAEKGVTPHTFRHSTAVALVAAGVDVTVIRSWLGHVHLDTTNRYAQANLETKRKALEQITEGRPDEPARWKGRDGLLEWLDTL